MHGYFRNHGCRHLEFESVGLPDGDPRERPRPGDGDRRSGARDSTSCSTSPRTPMSCGGGTAGFGRRTTSRRLRTRGAAFRITSRAAGTSCSELPVSLVRRAGRDGRTSDRVPRGSGVRPLGVRAGAGRSRRGGDPLRGAHGADALPPAHGPCASGAAARRCSSRRPPRTRAGSRSRLSGDTIRTSAPHFSTATALWTRALPVSRLTAGMHTEWGASRRRIRREAGPTSRAATAQWWT